MGTEFDELAMGLAQSFGRRGARETFGAVAAGIMLVLAGSCGLFTVVGPATAQTVDLEVLYSFEIGPKFPKTSLVEGSDGSFFGTTSEGGATRDAVNELGTVFKVTTNGDLTTLFAFDGVKGSSPNGLVLGPDGNFYGTTYSGGAGRGGTVFQVTPDGGLTTLYSFNRTKAANPKAGLLLAQDGNFYGTTDSQVVPGFPPKLVPATVFKVTTSGVLTTIASFTGFESPRELVQGDDGNFYGTTVEDDSDSLGTGTIFKCTPGGVLTTLVRLNGANRAGPYAALVPGADGKFYGTTSRGGNDDSGSVFTLSTNGDLTTIYSFSGGDDGWGPDGRLWLGGDGNFYGTTSEGGSFDSGTVFKVTTNGVLTTLHSFGGEEDGGFPLAGLMQGSDGDLYGTTLGTGSGNFGTVFKITTNGSLTTLCSFTGATYGAAPSATLLAGSDGNLYGTTQVGGGNDLGTVFKITSGGLLTLLASFRGTNGANPHSQLALGSDGSFYGTTTSGGTDGFGAVFRLTTNGVLNALYSFSGGDDGDTPYADLTLGNDGDFYGTTSGDTSGGCGTVFRVTTNGVLTTLYSFTGTPDGCAPYAGLLLGADGNFYGTTGYGGTDDLGTVFRATTDGTVTILHSFSGGDDGDTPYAGLALGSDGNFYGTTTGYGGSGFGTVFRTTADGVLTTLHSFSGGGDGEAPEAGLAPGGDGNLYGTTSGGYSGNGYGTVFQLTINGALTTLVPFNDSNGAYPLAGLELGGDGKLYGTTGYGGTNGGGTIFRMALPTPISLFTNVVRLPSGDIFLTGTGPANAAYRLWASADPSWPPASWTLLTSDVFLSDGSFSYSDASAGTNATRFYRLSLP